MELPKHSTGSRLVILWGARETIFLKKKKHYIAGDYLQNYTQQPLNSQHNNTKTPFARLS